VNLPEEYILQKFYQYCGGVKHNKAQNNYQGSCALCREDSSWLKKKRCYYLVDRNLIYCHNCGISYTPLTWIKEVTGDTVSQILKEAESFDFIPIKLEEKKKEPSKKIPSLPYDSINLFDQTQLDFYKDNKIVQKALEIIKNRRLDTAVNKPKTLWLSLKDIIHANRLVIPFYDDQNEIIFYQTRTILESDSFMEKYLGKKNSEKSLYGMNNIDNTLNYIFILEGPINAFFVRNGTAVCGIQDGGNINLTQLQQQQLSIFKFLKQVWVLDSQWIDNTSFNKTQKLIENKELVFIWPEEVGKKFKDFNDLAIYYKLNEISAKFILDNTFSGLGAKLRMSEISRWKQSNVP
jgi:hypothetical protein